VNAPILTPALCKAARALAGLTQRQLSARAGVGNQTLADFERGARQTFESNLEKLHSALEDAGVEFMPESSSAGPGVRLAKRKAKKSRVSKRP
jgi:transcriptional regulator with XRE-family HTH domain